MRSFGWTYDQGSNPWKLDLDADDTVTITTYQDVESIIEQNKKDLLAYGDKLTFGKASGMGHDNGVRVASIPSNVYDQWWKETNGEIRRPKVLAKYLNDPDNKHFRTTPTRI